MGARSTMSSPAHESVRANARRGSTSFVCGRWESVDPLWKAGGSVSFDPKTLEKAFPTQAKEKEKRVQLWKELDNNGNSFVSLAEFDSWFNNYTKRYEDANRKKGSPPPQAN